MQTLARSKLVLYYGVGVNVMEKAFEFISKFFLYLICGGFLSFIVFLFISWTYGKVKKKEMRHSSEITIIIISLMVFMCFMFFVRYEGP
jgi:predicted PurR-regulated permease PerM